MTYDAFETSEESGTPSEAYLITAGSRQWRLTSDASPVTISSNTYTPTAGLQRTRIAEGGDARAQGITFELPASHELAQEFAGTIPGVRYSVQVFRFHRADTPTPQVITIFDGFISKVEFKEQGKIARMSAITILGSIRRQIPRRKFQGMCNHVLYDSDTCKADDTDPNFRASNVDVVSQVGNVLTVASLPGSFVDTWCDGGYVESASSGDFRLILSQTGTALTLSLPFGTLPSKVNVFAGCDHTPDGAVNGCGPKFGNLVNYGGFPYIPTSNPFKTGI